MTTDRCDAITDGDKVTFDIFSDVAMETTGTGTYLKGQQCRKNARYSLPGPYDVDQRACRDHLAYLVDASKGDWSGDMVAVRRLGESDA